MTSVLGMNKVLRFRIDAAMSNVKDVLRETPVYRISQKFILGVFEDPQATVYPFSCMSGAMYLDNVSDSTWPNFNFIPSY